MKGKPLTVFILFLLSGTNYFAQGKRARDYDVPFNGTPGEFNSITVLAGANVAHTTIMNGEGLAGINGNKVHGLPKQAIIHFFRKV